MYKSVRSHQYGKGLEGQVNRRNERKIKMWTVGTMGRISEQPRRRTRVWKVGKIKSLLEWNGRKIKMWTVGADSEENESVDSR